MRPIDADTLENMGYELHRTYRKDANTMVYEVKKIADVPTIDLLLRDKENGITYAPVRRGRWKEIDYPVSECSLCKYMVDTLNVATSYCPNCGAKMEMENDY